MVCFQIQHGIPLVTSKEVLTYFCMKSSSPNGRIFILSMSVIWAIKLFNAICYLNLWKNYYQMLFFKYSNLKQQYVIISDILGLQGFIFVPWNMGFRIIIPGGSIPINMYMLIRDSHRCHQICWQCIWPHVRVVRSTHPGTGLIYGGLEGWLICRSLARGIR